MAEPRSRTARSDSSASGSSSDDSAIEPQGYEQARDELLEVVRRLEAGGTTLEEALALWERGEHLATVAQQWLDGARRRMDAAAEPDGKQVS